MRMRSLGSVVLQESNAWAAAFTARSTSSAPPSGTSPRTCSVDGSMICSVRPSAASTGFPPTNIWYFFMRSTPRHDDLPLRQRLEERDRLEHRFGSEHARRLLHLAARDLLRRDRRR